MGSVQRWPGLSGIAYGGMADDVRDMTRLCLYCADSKAGALVPRTLEKNPHGRQLNAVLNFVFLYMGESAVDAGIDAACGFQYVLVLSLIHI